MYIYQITNNINGRRRIVIEGKARYLKPGEVI